MTLREAEYKYIWNSLYSKVRVRPRKLGPLAFKYERRFSEMLDRTNKVYSMRMRRKGLP